jgi:arylamine N-acetyltransferase
MKVLADFVAHFGIKPGGPPRRLLDDVVTAFARLPYENITKIIKRAEHGSPEPARRYPGEVIHNHIRWGAGGTCFSLTSALLHLVRCLGWKAEYILADRRYGQDTHCALVVWVGNVPHLLDPGFLIVRPVQLRGNREQEIETGINHLILAPAGEPGKFSLSTVREGVKTYRLTYKTSSIDESEFFRAWNASFGWEMMRYPLLTRTEGGEQIYLRGSRIQISRAGFVEKREISEKDLIARIAAEFRIDPSLVSRAVSILRDRGEMHHGKVSGN